MWKLLLFSCLFLAVPAGAQDCCDYEQPAGSLLVASRTMPGSIVLFDADADRLCWAEVLGTPNYMILHWCRIDARGGLTELGTTRLQHDGVDYMAGVLMVEGKMVVVSDLSGGWSILDFADPAAPRVAWEVPAGFSLGPPILSGPWLYVPTAAGLALLELEDGQPPVQRALLAEAAMDPSLTYSGVPRVAVDGNRVWALIAEGSYDEGIVSLLLIDCADPAAPALLDRRSVGSWKSDNAETVYAFAADQGQVVLTRQSRHYNHGQYDYRSRHEVLFFACNGSDRIGEPALFGVSSYNPRAVIAGNHAWIAEIGRIHYFENRSGSWTAVDAYSCDGNGFGTPDVAAGRGLLWLANGRELTAVVAKLPESWPVVAQVYRPDEGDCLGLAASGSGLVALVGNLWWTNSGYMGWGLVGLMPAVPGRVEQQPLFVVGDHDYINIGIVGDFAYTEGGIWDLRTRTRVNETSSEIFGATGAALWGVDQGRLVAYDGTDPAAPVRHGAYFPIAWDSSYKTLFATSDEHAFFANGDTLIAASLAAPFEPVAADRLITGLGTVRDLLWGDGLLYVAQSAGLAVVGVEPDGHLTLRGSLEGPTGGLVAMALGGRTLYAVDASNHVRVIDIGNPDLPWLIAEPSVRASGLVWQDGVLYVLDDGVTTLRCQCTPALPVALTDLSLVWRAGVAHLSWRMSDELLDVRVLARVDGREWIVPWRVDNGLHLADDSAAPLGRTVEYAVQTRMGGDWSTLREESLAIPDASLELAAPTPNPFNGGTVLRYSLDAPGPVAVTVYDAAGRAVRTLVNARQEAGAHVASWRGDDNAGRPVAAGAYIVRLSTGRGQRSASVMLLK